MQTFGFSVRLICSRIWRVQAEGRDDAHQSSKGRKPILRLLCEQATVHAWDGHEILRTLRFSNALPMLSVSDNHLRAQLLRRRPWPVGIGRMEIMSSMESIPRMIRST
ncbi:hypothetical protein N7G274_008096 [Stereocaulon virgatum]|uniref:Uncharacterized protein n=1 Tax=Stereocaulon virgatum TaxID=373712 RepID=A0ABR4A3T0_9LECA